MDYFEIYHPGLSIDCVIFGFHEKELKVLLLKMQNMDKWAVPGGFVKKDEDVDTAAVRVLKERASVTDVYLKQYHLFGDITRNNSAYVDKLVDKKVITDKSSLWFHQRFVTLGYYALVEFSKVTPAPDHISDSCEWVSLSELPELILDHQQIITKALHALRKQLKFQPIGKNLLPEKFTMTELRVLYETILGEELDRRNFQRKMLGYGILTKLKETRKGGAHKAPFLYCFNEEIYNRSLENGFNTVW
tara:strand:+ start:16080 stop:16820 length:741 start_codon:yes stop_codon:yes gene_type:complete